MAKNYLLEIAEPQTLNGKTVEVTVATVVRAHPKRIRVGGEWVENVDGIGEYVRLHRNDTGQTFLWAGSLDDVDENTEMEDPRWVAE